MKQGNIFGDKIFYGKLWKLTVPIAVQSLMLASVAAADAIMLGRVEQNAMAAVSLATQIQFIQNMVLGAIVAGLVILGAQYWGKGDKKTINDLFCMSIRLAGVTSILFFIGCIFFPRWLMLIFTNEELKMKFFLAKGPDVPTYVEYGAADIGIVGKDTILEEGRKLYEVMDLGFGKCKMCVCGPESAREVLENNQLIRVATKYPNIAKDYFFNRKHQTVDLIKLNGSIELAPIVGLSEVIVDIVETGSTLKENGLKVLEEVCPLSARMVVNQVSMKMENERIRKLIEDLRRVLQEEM